MKLEGILRFDKQPANYNGILIQNWMLFYIKSYQDIMYIGRISNE